MDYALRDSVSPQSESHTATRGYLLLVVSLLLLQLILRVHHPDRLPFFIDEYRHISRAQLVYSLEHNPIEFTHGKLLLYYFLGMFSPEGHSAVILGRLSIALASLVTGAATAAIAHRLFGRVAALFALAFYALVPHAVFFERLALADPFASALATLSVWQLLHFIHSPTRRRAIVTGMLISGAVLAKLTAALLMGFPVIAVMLLSEDPIAGRSRKAIAQWSDALWQRYGKGLTIIGVICLMPWLILGVLAAISFAQGNQPILFPARMIGIQFNTIEAIRYRAEVLYTIIDTMLSVPVAAVYALAIPFLLWRAPRRTLFILMWLAVLWGPSLVVTWQPETRYLVIGYPALAVLCGALYWLVVEAIQAFSRGKGPAWRKSATRIAAGSVLAAGLGAWAFLFAVPFGVKASHAPETLALPRVETGIFFAGPNGWAVSDALAYLDEQGERFDDRIPVIGRFHFPAADQDYCGLVELYVPDSFDWDCRVIITDAEDALEETTPHDIWSDIHLSAEQQPFVYLVMDKQLPSLNTGAALDAVQVFARQRPHDGPTVRVWRVHSSDE